MDKRKKQKEKHEARSCSKRSNNTARNDDAVSHAVGGHHSPLESHLPFPEGYANASNEFLGLESVEEKPHFPRCTPGGVGCSAIGLKKADKMVGVSEAVPKSRSNLSKMMIG